MPQALCQPVAGSVSLDRARGPGDRHLPRGNARFT